MPVTIDTKSVKRALDSATKAAEHLPLTKAGDTLVNNIKANLGRGMTPWGDPFVPLKNPGVRRRGRGRLSPVPLNDTRQHIYNRITYKVVDDNTVIVGIMDSANARIGRVHQFGAVIHQPPRSQKAYYKVNFKTGASRFSRKSKANFSQWHTAKERVIRIPERPFLPIKNGAVVLPPAWAKELRRKVEDYLISALSG